MIRLMLAALLCTISAPAWAQMTAIYSGEEGGIGIRIEISASGDVRVSGDGAQDEMMILGGEVYVLNEGPEGPEVMRASDLAAATAEQFAKLPARGDSGEALRFTVTKRGDVTVNGRTGTAYYIDIPAMAPSGEPALVISTDPALAPLGAAMAKQFESAFTAMPAEAARIFPFREILAILKTGAPLAFSGLRLVSVDTAPVPAERFALPAAPMTREQVRARIAKSFALPGMEVEGETP